MDTIGWRTLSNEIHCDHDPKIFTFEDLALSETMSVCTWSKVGIYRQVGQESEAPRVDMVV